MWGAFRALGAQIPKHYRFRAAAALRSTVQPYSWCELSTPMAATAFMATGAFAMLPLRPSRCEPVCSEMPTPTREVFDRLVLELPGVEQESASWKKDTEQLGSNYSISISSAPTIVSFCAGRRYRTDFRISGAKAKQLTLEGIFKAMLAMDSEKRLQWDPNLYHAEVLHTPSVLEPDVVLEHVVLYRTKPVAGGVIASREFVEARRVVRQGDRLVFVLTRWDEEFGRPCGKGLQRGFNVTGVKGTIQRQEDGSIHFVTWGQTEVGGWIPTRLLNATVADAHLKFANSFLASLAVD